MNKKLFKLAAAVALMCGAQFAAAQSITAPTAAGVINGNGQTFTVAFDSVDTAGLDFDLNVAPAGRITITGGTSNFGANCAVANMGQTLICNAFAASGVLADGTITVTYNAGATTGPVNLTFANVVFRDGNAAIQPIPPAVVTPGTLTLNAGPSGPALAYNPAANTAIAVPASISGTAVTSTIAVTQTGGDTGQTTTLTCTAPAGYTATVTGSPFAVGGTGGSIGLACSGGAAAGNLTCSEVRSGAGGSTVNSTWPLTCASAPGFNSTPADGGTLSIVGIQGSVTPGAVAVSNPGTAALNISGCAVTGAGFTLGTVSATVASGGTGSIGVSCAVPAVAGTTITGTLQCNTNAAAPADVINYNLSCLSQSASIPTLGLGGKALMVLLMLGFGLVGFQLYRRSA